jgi:acyl dehydratase
VAVEHGSRAGKEIADMSEKYLEDFAVGQIYGSGCITVEKERIKTFAAEFDPQPFHQDEEAARRSIFGGLAASGWHTAALTMRKRDAKTAAFGTYCPELAAALSSLHDAHPQLKGE